MPNDVTLTVKIQSTVTDAGTVKTTETRITRTLEGVVTAERAWYSIAGVALVPAIFSGIVSIILTFSAPVTESERVVRLLLWFCLASGVSAALCLAVVAISRHGVLKRLLHGE